MSSRNRRAKDFRRPPPTKTERPCILIVCEGEKTEPSYFNALKGELRLSSVDVEVEGKECGSAPISVVNRAIAMKNRRAEIAATSTTKNLYDEIWCVIDVECPPHKTLDNAWIKARGNQLKVVLSNPGFEYWYLLHFEKTSALMYGNDKVIERLKNHLPNYQKNDPDVFSKIYQKTDTAISNAKSVIAEKHYEEDLRTCNPSTDVHRLVEYVRKM